MSFFDIDEDREEEDESLMAALSRGDSTALRSLHDRYHRLLLSIAMNVVRDTLDAEEVLQDVFLHIWNRANAYSAAKGKPLPWLVMLTRRRAIDRLRQQRSYRRATGRFETEYLRENEDPVPHFGRSPQMGGNDLRLLLQQHLQRLPPAQKEAVELTYFKGMSQREIASARKLPLGTVKTRIELGLRKLSHILLCARPKIA